MALPVMVEAIVGFQETPACEATAQIRRKAVIKNGGPEAAATSMAVSTPYFCSLLRLAHLAPDITTAILDGRQPAHLNRQFLARTNNLPIDWQGQREMLGFA